MPSQFQNVSAALARYTLSRVTSWQRRKFFGASINVSSIRIWSVYHTPERAISSQVQSLASIFLLYQSGYFHWNELFSNTISRLSLSGDSPSLKIVCSICNFFPWNKGRSPVRYAPFNSLSVFIFSTLIFYPLYIPVIHTLLFIF